MLGRNDEPRPHSFRRTEPSMMCNRRRRVTKYRGRCHSAACWSPSLCCTRLQNRDANEGTRTRTELHVGPKRRLAGRNFLPAGRQTGTQEATSTPAGAPFFASVRVSNGRSGSAGVSHERGKHERKRPETLDWQVVARKNNVRWKMTEA